VSDADAAVNRGDAMSPRRENRENERKRIRDVSLGEDASRVRKGSGPEVTAALRNAAIGFLRSTGATKIVETIRRNASQPGQLFAKLDVFKK